MYVCLCKGVTDGQIRAEVEEGAATLREVSRRLGVATQCGKCAGCARQVIRDAVAGQCTARQEDIACGIPVSIDLAPAI